MKKDIFSQIMPIGGWVAPPSENYGSKIDFLTDEVFNKVRESGVNILYTNIDRTKHLPDLIQTIKCAEKAGVYLMIGDDSFVMGGFDEKEAIEFIEICKKSPAVIGIDFADEPNCKKFDKLKAVCEKYKPHMGDLLCYVKIGRAHV